VQYADYAHWQQQWLHSEAGKAQLMYWLQQLQAPLPLLELPTDRPRTGELSLHMARQSFHISSALADALRRLSHQEGTTLFMTLLAAFKTLLYGYTGQADIRVGTLVANRQHQETEGLIGLFANLVILRTNLGGNPNMRQVLQRVRTTTLAAYAHQELPFEYLVQALERARQLERQSLLQAMFVMQHAGQRSLALPGVTSTVIETHPVAASTCDMVVSLRHNASGLDGVCVYKTTLFDTTTMVRMLADFQRLLSRFMVHTEQPLSMCHALWEE
jgi:non-ribosomal peptide synthetase component F